MVTGCVEAGSSDGGTWPPLDTMEFIYKGSMIAVGGSTALGSLAKTAAKDGWLGILRNRNVCHYSSEAANKALVGSGELQAQATVWPGENLGHFTWFSTVRVWDSCLPSYEYPLGKWEREREALYTPFFVHFSCSNLWWKNHAYNKRDERIFNVDVSHSMACAWLWQMSGGNPHTHLSASTQPPRRQASMTIPAWAEECNFLGNGLHSHKEQ